MVLHFDVILLMITFLISILAYRRYHDEKYLRTFPLFFLIVIIVEFTGTWLQARYGTNTFLYNLYSILEFSFFLFFYLQIFKRASVKRRIRYLLVIFPLLCLVNIFFVQGMHAFHTYSFTLGSIIINVLGVLYFFQLFNGKEKVNLLKHPAFWINVALIFFYTTSMSFLSVLNYVSTLPKSITLQLVKLLVVVNSLKYTLFIIAFLCRINFRRSTYNTLG